MLPIDAKPILVLQETLEPELGPGRSIQTLLGLDGRGRWQSKDRAGLDDERLFPVAQGSEEFRTIAGEFARTLPTLSVDEIHRVENGPLHELYSVHRRNVERDVEAAQAGSGPGGVRQGPLVRLLFHGTSEENVQCIVHSDTAGFLPLLSGTKTGALWGDGTYFARDASYSDSYACRLPSGQKQVLRGLVVLVLHTSPIQFLQIAVLSLCYEPFPYY
jgi:hypothetical protein